MRISHVKTGPLIWERGPKKPPSSPGVWVLAFLLGPVLWLISITPHWLMVVLGVLLGVVAVLTLVVMVAGRTSTSTARVTREPARKAGGSDYGAEYRAREALARAKVEERAMKRRATTTEPGAVTLGRTPKFQPTRQR